MISRNPLITVLMPCYNAGHFLKDAIDSIINQTYSNLEILLIDDGSTDGSRETILSYASRDPRIKAVFNEQNLGLIRTLNKGVDIASGEFIARMDSDDVSRLNRIEKLLTAFGENPEVDVMAAGYFSMSENGKHNRRVYPKACDSDALLFVSFFSTPVNHPCMMAKSSVLKANAFDLSYIHSEDYEIFSRLLLSGSKFMNLDEPLYHLRRNSQSVSYKYEKIQIANHSRISERNIEKFFNRKFDYFLHKVMINRISFNVAPSLISCAFSSFAELREIYRERIRPSDKSEKQIDDFLTEQKIDIFFQSLKYASWYNRIGIAILMLINLHHLLNRRGVRYIYTKIF